MIPVTRDIDIVVDLKQQDARRLETLFPQPEFYCPPLEILSDEIINRGQFNLLHVPTGLKNLACRSNGKTLLATSDGSKVPKTLPIMNENSIWISK
jgi:hypothetical protein